MVVSHIVGTCLRPPVLQNTCQDCSQDSTLLPVVLLLLGSSLELFSVLLSFLTECGTVKRGEWVDRCWGGSVGLQCQLPLSFSMSVVPILSFPSLPYHLQFPSEPSHPVPTPPLPLVPHFPSSPPLLLKARPGHWMVCRHVLLRTVPGGGWSTATFSSETACTSECYCDRATLHVQLSQTCHFLFEAPNYLVYCFCFSCLDRHFL